MFDNEPAEGQLAHLNNFNGYYRDCKSKIILAELHKLLKHHAAYIMEICNRKDD